MIEQKRWRQTRLRQASHGGPPSTAKIVSHPPALVDRRFAVQTTEEMSLQCPGETTDGTVNGDRSSPFLQTAAVQLVHRQPSIFGSQVSAVGR